ncbi:MAG: Rrf2 family transcriptional regulator [Myxococcales bacterium]|nr:Rrf2 family transcriptional regulator [Myxococcales bacterium]
MTVLALRRDEPTSSEMLAGSVGTNAAVIRRILSMLAKHGLVRSRLGAGGGALLARTADEITLAEVYRAVETGELICTHRCEPSSKCVVGARILDVLEPIRQRAESAMFTQLEQVRLSMVSTAVLEEADQPATAPAPELNTA